MKRRSLIHAMLVSVVLGFAPALAEATDDRGSVAERFFRGVYGCDAGVVRELASDTIVVTYPVFREVLGTSALRGSVAVESFVKRFCAKWTAPEVTIHESLSDGLRVVLVWSFSAQDTASPPDAPRSHWGGISLFRFNADGKITAELGEESTPGPVARLRQAAVP